MGMILGIYVLHAYPEYFRGFVNVSGLVNYWYHGLWIFFRSLLVCYGFVDPNGKEMIGKLNDN